MKIFKSEKFQKIFYPLFYLAFTVAISISGCFIFNRYYYTNIFVSGPSMMPTLVGDDYNNIHHYGIADTSQKAIDKLERFDVVITYYPESWGARTGLIVKRVWGFPGERIVLSSSESESTFSVWTTDYSKETPDFTITAEVESYTFDKIKSFETWKTYKFQTEKRLFRTRVNKTQYRSLDYTLGENEYFVMGDNWGDSTDSYMRYTYEQKLTRDCIQGRVVCIQGYGKVVLDGDKNYKIVDKHPIRPIYHF